MRSAYARLTAHMQQALLDQQAADDSLGSGAADWSRGAEISGNRTRDRLLGCHQSHMVWTIGRCAASRRLRWLTDYLNGKRSRCARC